MKGNIAHGAGYLMRGAKLLKQPSLRHFVLIPLLVNIVIFGGLISSTLLDSLLTPLMFWLWGKAPLERLLAERSGDSY